MAPNFRDTTEYLLCDVTMVHCWNRMWTIVSEITVGDVRHFLWSVFPGACAGIGLGWVFRLWGKRNWLQVNVFATRFNDKTRHFWMLAVSVVSLCGMRHKLDLITGKDSYVGGNIEWQVVVFWCSSVAAIGSILLILSSPSLLDLLYDHVTWVNQTNHSFNVYFHCDKLIQSNMVVL